MTHDCKNMEFYILMFGASIEHITTVQLKKQNKQTNQTKK